MRALVYDRYAQDDDFESILSVRQVDDPVAGPGQVVFKTRAAALNYDDIWGMRGRPLAVPLPHISGTDAAGDIVSVGPGVSSVSVGDRIVSYGNLSCGICAKCTGGRAYDCPKRRIWGFETGPLWGGYCELGCLPEQNIVRIPDGVSYEDAAAASMTLMTAWHMLVGRARICPGQAVLVMGGGSGMGIFGIQIAKLYGCCVIATAGPDKLGRCLELGADYAVDHRQDGWDRQVRQICSRLGRPGIDVVFEHIGGRHWPKAVALLRRGATLVTTGATTGYDVQTDLRCVFAEGISILGSTQGTRAELEQGLYWMSQKRIRAVIDSRYALEQAAQAHQKMARSRGLFGKMIILP